MPSLPKTPPPQLLGKPGQSPVLFKRGVAFFSLSLSVALSRAMVHEGWHDIRASSCMSSCQEIAKTDAREGGGRVEAQDLDALKIFLSFFVPVMTCSQSV